MKEEEAEQSERDTDDDDRDAYDAEAAALENGHEDQPGRMNLNKNSSERTSARTKSREPQSKGKHGPNLKRSREHQALDGHWTGMQQATLTQKGRHLSKKNHQGVPAVESLSPRAFLNQASRAPSNRGSEAGGDSHPNASMMPQRYELDGQHVEEKDNRACHKVDGPRHEHNAGWHHPNVEDGRQQQQFQRKQLKSRFADSSRDSGSHQ